MNQVMVGGASVFKSHEENNSFMKGLSLMSNSVHYQFQPESASEQFRYWVATNQHQHEIMLVFFNLLNDNKIVKEGAKIILDRIYTNMKIYVPMLTPKFTMEESLSYDNMTDARFEELSQTRQEEVRTEGVQFHGNESTHDAKTHVKIRLLHR